MDVLRLGAVVALTLGLAVATWAETPPSKTAQDASSNTAAASTEGGSPPIAAPAHPAAAIAALPPPEFDGVKPGMSTLEEVLERWGAPKEVRGGDGREIYAFEKVPFKWVEVILEKESVESVVLHFQQPLPAAEAATRSEEHT